MRVLFWYCDKFAWNPSIKTLDDAPDAAADAHENSIVAFIHVEPNDVEGQSSAETKLVKNAKWLARKWETKRVILHSFTHLGEKKQIPDLPKRFSIGTKIVWKPPVTKPFKHLMAILTI